MENHDTTEFDERYAREQLRRAEHPLRRFVKALYLASVLREIRGPCIDLGCGAGQLLEKLPPSSIGIEVNPALIRALRARGLDVHAAAAGADPFILEGLPTGRFNALVLSHVLEHFNSPEKCLERLLLRCRELGVRTVVVIVPGLKGFHSDATHKTFIDNRYLLDHNMLSCGGYRLRKTRYFPINFETAGRFFLYQELKLVYEQV